MRMANVSNLVPRSLAAKDKCEIWVRDFDVSLRKQTLCTMDF